MALGAPGPGGRGRGRRRARRRPLSEINVTPLVDVMLVLLIIFMVAAPLLTVAVPLELPKTDAGSVEQIEEPITVSIQRNGSIYIDEDPATLDQLGPRVSAMAGNNLERPIFVRGDAQAPYGTVAQVMGRLSASGFTRLNLVTDSAAPATRAAAPAVAQEAPEAP
ncbi:MAG TPA: biopolymer transporter ExbD [Brevundimonas sp.]|jgi:biopolymer transport protein TolR|uniref:ExbD/TolR family protein n=1 Tax=Brevundimonas sp. TaxID=1871086 RepID=UPI002CEE73FE|nr:biopolymer transporter ExbD [Brevundimonas sp.]HRH20940.1 biopolymer transporter ExbD [Brevundimonas sp.]